MKTEQTINNAEGQAVNVDPLISRMRLLEVNHAPDGWPAVKMKDVSELCGIVERAAGLLSDLTGTCPVDHFNWEPPFDCENTCPVDNDDSACWLAYLGG